MLTPAEVLEAVPHREPFRFVERVLAIDDETVVATARFAEDADFYRGHFPEYPVTPGVILLESMAQAALVTHAIYLADLAGGREARSKLIPVFTDAEVEFTSSVPPGARVHIRGEKLFYRCGKLRSRVGTLAGKGISR
jgi:3-hydroxyacyl-[acyl-carrier-protein] dehydratase